ncbi:hypothetical protein D3C81_1377210 [compost metagenome]
MRCALGSVHNDYCTVTVSDGCQLFYRMGNAHYIGDICYGDDPGLIRNRLLGILKRNGPILLQRNELQGGPCLLRQLLPWNKVAVMLHLGDDDLVAFTDVSRAVRRSYNIQSRRCAAGKDNLLRAAGVNEFGQLLAGPLVSIRSPAAERMDTTVHVGVIPFIIGFHRLDDLARLL